jgi:iron(III) transport system permease protein
MLLLATLCVAFVCTLWPTLGLMAQLGSPEEIAAALRSGAPALANSLGATLGAALLALALGTVSSGALARASGPMKSVWVTMLILPLCIPGPVYGIAWVELASTLHSSMRAAVGSVPALVPALCLAARWSGLVAVLVAAARLALPRHALDAARLQDGSTVRRFWWIELPWIAPVVIGAVALVCALAQTAIGVLVLTVPPGFEVAPLRIDNLLHYGAREQAVALAVCSAGLAAALPLVLVTAARALGRRST